MVDFSDPPLGSSGNAFTTAGQRAVGRSERHLLKSFQRGLTDNRSSRLCFFAAGPLVTVSVGRLLIAHVSGVRHCGSPWSCSICAPVIRERRAREVDRAVSGHLDQGGAAVLVSPTGPHHFGDPLEPLLAVMAKCVGSWTHGRTWSGLSQRLGYVGAIRALDITYGKLNGWHPHAHALLLFSRELSVYDGLDLHAHIFRAHQRALHRAGFGDLDPVHGVDFRCVYSASELASYVAKVEGGWGVGRELARGDLKYRGETPFDLLRRCAEGELGQVVALWSEYERATFGKRFMVWGRGLRARLLPDELEISDEEAASMEGDDDAVVTVTIAREEWAVYCRMGQVGEVLRRIEEYALSVMEISDFLSDFVVEKREMVDA